MKLDTALAVHRAVFELLAAEDPRRRAHVGTHFLGILMGIDLVAHDPEMAAVLREALGTMQDNAGPAIPDGRHDLDVDVVALAAVVRETIQPVRSDA